MKCLQSWLLISSSVLRSLPPWESAVWTKPLMEEAKRSSCRQKLVPPLQAVTYQREEAEEAKADEKREGKCKRQRQQENRFSQIAELITPTEAVSTNGRRRRRTGWRKTELKSQKEHKYEGRGHMHKKCHWGKCPIVFELIAPT